MLVGLAKKILIHFNLLVAVFDLEADNGSDSDGIIGGVIAGTVVVALLGACCIYFCSKLRCRLRNAGALGLN